MKKTGKVKHRSVGGLTLIVVLALLAGCSGKQDDVTEEPLDGIVSEDEESNISENEISDGEEAMNGGAENDLFEDEEQVIVYRIEPDEVVNIEEALSEFWSNESNYEGETIIAEGYVEDIPVPIELQELLLYGGDRSEWAVECEAVTEEMAADLPEALLLDAHSFRDFYWNDFDGDGENEYFHYRSNGELDRNVICIHKNIDGRWVEAELWRGSILYYEGRYYVDSYGSLNWLKDDFEYYYCPALIGEAGGWGTLRLDWTITGYTPYETYSNTQDDSIDFLENINWETLEDQDAVQVEIKTDDSRMIGAASPIYIWTIEGMDTDTENTDFRLRYGWERYYEGEQYLYVVINEYAQRRSMDMGLVILHQTEDEMWEIVKAYYLTINRCRALKYQQ